jgi:hypothetical protein
VGMVCRDYTAVPGEAANGYQQPQSAPIGIDKEVPTPTGWPWICGIHQGQRPVTARKGQTRDRKRPLFVQKIPASLRPPTDAGTSNSERMPHLGHHMLQGVGVFTLCV